MISNLRFVSCSRDMRFASVLRARANQHLAVTADIVIGRTASAPRTIAVCPRLSLVRALISLFTASSQFLLSASVARTVGNLSACGGIVSSRAKGLPLAMSDWQAWNMPRDTVAGLRQEIGDWHTFCRLADTK